MPAPHALAETVHLTKRVRTRAPHHEPDRMNALSFANRAGSITFLDPRAGTQSSEGGVAPLFRRTDRRLRIFQQLYSDRRAGTSDALVDFRSTGQSHAARRFDAAVQRNG